MYECTLYMRADFTVSSASEFYYDFVGSNSVLPFTDLIDPEDAIVLKDCISRDLKSRQSEASSHTQPETQKSGAETAGTSAGEGQSLKTEACTLLELCTRLYNRIDEGWRNVWIYVEKCDRTEEGNPLYLVTVIDVNDARDRMASLNRNAHKYRYYMSIKDEYYFEYYPKTGRYTYYKYVNGKSMPLYNGDLDEHIRLRNEEAGQAEYMVRQTARLATFLKSAASSFEMNWVSIEKDGSSVQFLIKGGVSIYAPDMVTGVIVPDSASSELAYYLTSAGKDPFTGLLNKKASTEYSVEKISEAGDRTMWMLIMDIDDFKTFNDNFGHAFGDEVIKTVAGTLQMHMSPCGVVGRFGGDEFFALLHDIPTREDLKMVLKVVARDLLFAYDEKKKLTMSIGISQYPKDGRDFDTLFGKADKCLYIAKEKGKNRHIIYDPEKHGEYTEDSIKFQAVSYIASHEKRRSLLADCVIGMQSRGVKYFLENRKVRRGIMEIFDLGGITIYGKGGRTVLLRDGKYASDPENRWEIADETYTSQYADTNVMVLNNLDRLKTISEAAYLSAVKQEIGSSVRCAVKRGNTLSVFVDFDVLNTNRKWSDADVDLLTLLGCTIAEMILKDS